MSTEFTELHSKIGNAVTIDALKRFYENMSSEYKSAVAESAFLSYFSGKRKESILWHDYEAGGTHGPSVTPLQFAGVRTNLDLEPIDIPIDIYCKLDWDRLPHPEAIAITKINPLKCMHDGLPEPVFFREINKEMLLPGTCTSGYNSMKYDESVSRFGFWRSVIPVYDREYKNGNSRWDILPVVATYASLGVKGVKIPVLSEGNRSLKLENLAKSNNILQENAHNAVDDVYALIALAKLLKASSPLLWDYCYSIRLKKNAQSKCLPASSGMLFTHFKGDEGNYCTPIVILGASPRNTNSERVYLEIGDRDKVRALWRPSVDVIGENLFSSKERLGELGVERPPLSSLKVNESPVFIPFSWLQKNGFDVDDSSGLLAEKVMAEDGFVSKLLSVFSKTEHEAPESPELALFSGFPSKEDAFLIASIYNNPVEKAFGRDEPGFGDSNLSAVYKNARARLRNEEGFTLSDNELYDWKSYCARRQWAEIDPDSKSDILNLTNVKDLLDSVDMDDELKSGYCDYLKWVKDSLS
jgi:exodeoxyribonuclease-1